MLLRSYDLLFNKFMLEFLNNKKKISPHNNMQLRKTEDYRCKRRF